MAQLHHACRCVACATPALSAPHCIVASSLELRFCPDTLHLRRCTGRLLGTVGRFTAAAAPAPAAAQIAAASAELLCHPSIAGHPEPFVRRSALFAAAQVHDTLSFGARP